MISLVLAPVPLLSTILLVVLAALPWGGPDWSELALEIMVVASVYFWSLRRPNLMPPLIVFGCGLTLDVLTQGPLGVWTSAVLLAAFSGRSTRHARPRFGWLRSMLQATMTLVAAAGLVTVLMSIYAWQPAAGEPLLHALGAAVLAYPALAAVLSLVDAIWPTRDAGVLFLRGD